MNTSLASLSKSKGSVLVITALSLVALMGVAGLAIDLSHAEVDKTRLQNLADSLALSAAIRLNESNNAANSTDEVAAETYAKDKTFNWFKASDGNVEIANGGLCSSSGTPSVTTCSKITFTFAKITNLNTSKAEDWVAAASINDANFARVTVDAMNVPTWFGRIFGINNTVVSTSAVAGETPIAPCNLAPIMMCAENPTAPDIDCSDGACYGFTIDNIYCLTPDKSNSGGKCAASGTGVWGPGNIGYVNLGSVYPDLNKGADTLGKCLAGDPSCQNYCDYSPDLSQLPNDPGDKWGPVQEGISAIFNNSKNPQYSSLPPDTITGEGGQSGIPNNNDNGPITNSISQSSTLTYLNWDKISTLKSSGAAISQIPTTGLNPSNLTDSLGNLVPSPYTVYKTFSSGIETKLPSTAQYGKRILNVPLANCAITPPGGSGTVPIIGFGCFLLTAEAEKQGSEVFILGQFIADQNLCQSTGDDTLNNSTFHKVILYKDPFGGQS